MEENEINQEDKTTFRVNIKVPIWINEWFDAKSKETGISKSALMSMALNEYIDQKTSIQAMSRVDYFINKIDEVQKYVDNRLEGK